LLCDLLWSDPDKDITGWSENDRGVSFTFGPDVVSRFLQKHDMDLICRAHQVVEDGYEFFSKRQLVTLFSAPNYCGEFDNAGAMMSVDESLLCSFQVRIFCPPFFTFRKAMIGLETEQLHRFLNQPKRNKSTFTGVLALADPSLLRESRKRNKYELFHVQQVRTEIRKQHSDNRQPTTDKPTTDFDDFQHTPIHVSFDIALSRLNFSHLPPHSTSSLGL
jgi:hypothetical protein